MLCNASEGRLTEAASGDGGETVPGATGAEKARSWYAPHMVDIGNIQNLSYEEHIHV